MTLAISLLSFRPGRVFGAETYLRELLRELPAAAGPDRLLAILDRDLARALETPGFERLVLDVGAARLVGERVLEAYTPRRARGIERAIAASGAEVVLFPQQSIFPRDLSLPAVLTVHDVQYLFHPENFGLFDRTYRPRVYPRSMAQARRIIAVSETTKRTLVERCGIEPDRIDAIPLGHRPPPPAEPWRGAGGPYLYYPAATHPHKGHEALLRSYAALRRTGAIPQRLVLSGIVTPHWRRLARLARRLGVAHDVLQLGYVPRARVEQLYAGADAVVFPSRFEGFGLPVLEAAAAGRKVIASRLEVFEEVGVPRRLQIDFADPDQLLAALRDDRPFALERRPWTWAETAAATVATLRRVRAEAGLVV
jgi:glycosyltransferase involved in cell wall biosynthesis